MFPILKASAFNKPDFEPLKAGYHQIQHALLMLGAGAFCIALAILLLLYFTERRKKKRALKFSAQSTPTLPTPLQSVPPEYIVKEVKHEPVREILVEKSHLPSETKEVTSKAIQKMSPDEEAILTLNFSGHFLIQSRRKGTLPLNSFHVALLPAKTEGGIGPMTISSGALVLGTFDMKGGWLRFANDGFTVLLLRKGEWKEFSSGSEPTSLQTLGLRKGDCIYFLPVSLPSGPGNVDSDSLKKCLIGNPVPDDMEKQGKIMEEKLFDLQRQNKPGEEIFLLGIRI